MFDWNDLRFFIEVAHGQSLLGAAKKFGVNHTTVARRIQALEESLEARLFDKTPAGYRLAPAGVELLEIADQIEVLCVSAQELVAGQDSAPAGVVRLSIPESFGSHFLVRHLGEFQRLYPDIELSIVALPEALSVTKREVDIAVTSSQPEVGRLIVRRLSDYSIRYYASKSYLKKFPKITNLEQIEKLDIITGRISTDEYQSMDEIIVDSQAKLRFRGVNSQLAAIEAGLGIGLLPCYMTYGRTDLVCILPRLKVDGTFWLSKHEDTRHIGRVKAVWEWIKNVVAQNRSELLPTY